MKTTVVACALLLMGLIVSAQNKTLPAPQAPAHPAGENGAVIARGEYLANHVSMCVQCHSTRDDHGDIIESQKFRGGAIPVTSPYRNEQWAFKAPNIAGLPGFTDEQIIALLTEGQATDRNPPKRPMPPFRLSRQDAEAIVAYLRSR
jgi:mono/diheme cytochrome c family protein